LANAILNVYIKIFEPEIIFFKKGLNFEIVNPKVVKETKLKKNCTIQIFAGKKKGKNYQKEKGKKRLKKIKKIYEKTTQTHPRVALGSPWVIPGVVRITWAGNPLATRGPRLPNCGD
jgi:hypothetical protein